MNLTYQNSADYHKQVFGRVRLDRSFDNDGVMKIMCQICFYHFYLRELHCLGVERDGPVYEDVCRRCYRAEEEDRVISQCQ